MIKQLGEISYTKLGFDSNGILTFSLIIDVDGLSYYGGGFGGYRIHAPIDAVVKSNNHLIIPIFGMECISNILQICQVKCWENLIESKLYVVREDDRSNIIEIESLNHKLRFNIMETYHSISNRVKLVVGE